MHDDSTHLIFNFVQGFTKIHKEDPRFSYLTLISAFISCYGILIPEERFMTINTLMTLVKDIGEEGFEDGQDFLSFLKEKNEVRKYMEK